MLHNAKELACATVVKGGCGNSLAPKARPRAASALASVWFTAYPTSIITHERVGSPNARRSEPLDSLVGHRNPRRPQWTDEALGVFAARIMRPQSTGTLIGSALKSGRPGTEEDFVAMGRTQRRPTTRWSSTTSFPRTPARAPTFDSRKSAMEHPPLSHGLHRGGRLGLLPPVPPGREAVNLAPTTVDQLKEKGHRGAVASRDLFRTGRQGDRLERHRYHHWCGRCRPPVGVSPLLQRGAAITQLADPTFALPQLIIGDALHSVDVLGARMLRLDANGFLGVERRAEGAAWSEGHPLSVVGNQLIAGMVRKAGGFSFQELNLTVDDIAAMSTRADLSYDFITRPAYHHALMTGDTEFLRLMLKTMRDYKIDPASLIHALHHDELTLELVHFWTLPPGHLHVWREKLDRRNPARALAGHRMRTADRQQRALQLALCHEWSGLHHRQCDRRSAQYPRPAEFD